MKIIFIGPQGCGKGTQAKFLSERLKISHISVGDLFRNLKGELKQEIEEIMIQGKLASDNLTLEIVKKRLENNDTKKGFILDGFPRNLNQAKLLETITNIDKVIEIELSDNEAIKRISGRVHCKNCKANYNELTAPKPLKKGICDVCGGELIRRADDTKEAVKKRLKTYHKETEPILEFYKDKIIKINGEQEIDDIAKEIEKSIN